ncbi:Cytochrome P450 3A4 [Nymphon striatum]|nr:Cytochrome P450 3A4 [Nymphon striatum]
MGTRIITVNDPELLNAVTIWMTVLLKTAETGEIRDYKEVFFSFAVNVVGKCFFGVEIDGGDPNGQFNIILQIVEARKGVKSDRMDFVQIAMDYLKDENNKENSMGCFTVQEIIYHAIIFIMGGVETTSTTLSLVAYNLAVYPEWQEKIQEEVDSIAEKHGCIDYDAVQEMPYLSAVIDETLRLYPASVHGDRVCSTDYDLGSISLPKGTVVMYTQYSMHRNPEFWSNPEEFDPERFLGENVKNHHPYAYLPFIHGPRNCIAKRFALLELKFCLARTLRKFRFVKCPQTDVPVKFKSGMDTLAVHSVNLQVETRP